jgi:hypothetical protein
MPQGGEDEELDDTPEIERDRRTRKAITEDMAAALKPMAAFQRELSILRTIRPLAVDLSKFHSALGASRPAAAHLRLFEEQFRAASLLANQNLAGDVMRAIEAASAIRITQDTAVTAAWASMIAKAAMPPPSVFEGLAAAVGAMSFDVSKFINANVITLANASLLLPKSSFGSEAKVVRLADWMSGPISSALASFREQSLIPPELPPVAFSTVASVGMSGTIFPAGTYEKAQELSNLESEVRAAGIELMRKNHPGLARKLDGARYALQGGNPDAASQAANSLVEAIDQFLRGQTDDEQVVAWCLANYAPGARDLGAGRRAPTRAGRLRYLAHTAGVSDTIGKSIATIVTTAIDVLQQAKHSDSNEDVIRNFVLIVEGSIGAAVSMTLSEALSDDGERTGQRPKSEDRPRSW